MSMSMRDTLKVIILQVIPICLIITLSGWLTYYLFKNLLGVDVNANIISIIFVIIGAWYIGRVIRQAGKSSQDTK